ncbi:hypothetical protein HHK36_006061 [Tetracentron sinense]|uniref:Uncharacterized protein n=1 Tax=Tetracentron sinense TaxID=13715 RepID=A0A834ZGJ1_TETSI|nr:hypothetical protein HHK36_006061 [Tetracentron sinense]
MDQPVMNSGQCQTTASPEYTPASPSYTPASLEYIPATPPSPFEYDSQGRLPIKEAESKRKLTRKLKELSPPERVEKGICSLSPAKEVDLELWANRGSASG